MGKGRLFRINAEKVGIHMERMNLYPYFVLYTKINSIKIIDINIVAQIDQEK